MSTNSPSTDHVRVQITSENDPATGKPRLANIKLGTSWGPFDFDKDGRTIATLPASALPSLAKMHMKFSHEIDSDLAAAYRIADTATIAPVDHKKLLWQLEQRHAELVGEHGDALRSLESLRRLLDEMRRDAQPLQDRLGETQALLEQTTQDLDAMRGRAETAERLLGEAASQRDQAESLAQELAAARAELEGARKELAALSTPKKPR